MYFMSPPDAARIPVIGIPEHLKTLVYKDVVYQKIRDSVGKYPQTYGPSLPKIRIHRRHDEGHAYNSIKDKERIISFKPGIVVLPVVVPVEAP